MNILVIGNGFDLAHGFPTRYIDFLQFLYYVKDGIDYIDESRSGDLDFYLLDKKSEMNHNKLNTSLIEFIESFLYKYSDNQLTQNEYKTIEIVKDNLWINYFTNDIVINDAISKGWIDFENYISSIVKTLNNDLDEVIKLESIVAKELEASDYELRYMGKIFYCLYNKKNNIDYLYLLLASRASKYNNDFDLFELFKNCKIDEHYYKKYIIKPLDDDLNKFSCVLEFYLDSFINNLTSKSIPLFKSLNVDCILSFNYTNTYNRFYDKENLKTYHYIHGKSHKNSIFNSNIVLGIDDYLIGNDANEKIDFIRFKKYFQRIHKKTGSQYKVWLNTDAKNNIYFFGHSLDITDKEILNELIMNPNSTSFIYYCDDEMNAQQISNLVRVIGKSNLLDKVSSLTPSIYFKSFTKNI